MTRDAMRGVFQPASNSAPQTITWTRKVILAPEEDRCAYYKVGVARSSESFVKSNSSDRRRPSALAEGCGRNAGENSPQYALKSLFEYQRTVSARPTSQDFSCRHPSAKSFEQSMKYLRSLFDRSRARWSFPGRDRGAHRHPERRTRSSVLRASRCYKSAPAFRGGE